MAVFENERAAVEMLSLFCIAADRWGLFHTPRPPLAEINVFHVYVPPFRIKIGLPTQRLTKFMPLTRIGQVVLHCLDFTETDII